MAAAVISTGPMLIAYAVSQKFMIRGIATTGLEGLTRTRPPGYDRDWRRWAL